MPEKGSDAIFVLLNVENCANGCNVTLGHNYVFDITDCLPELGAATRCRRLAMRSGANGCNVTLGHNMLFQ